jgi:DNA polymerase-3 subunit delta
VADIKDLMDYIERPNKNALLILSSDQINGVDKRLQAIVPKDAQKIFWEMFDNEKHGWVQQYVQSKNSRISADAIDLFLSMVSNESMIMASELQKLILMKEARAQETDKIQDEAATVKKESASSSLLLEITATDVEDFIYHSKEESVFSLFQEIALRNLTQGLEVLMKLSDSGENPIGILSGLAWQIRKLQELSNLSQSMTMDQALLKLSIRGKRSQNLYRQALNNYNAEDLQNCADLTARVEIEIRKLGSHIQLHILYLLIYSIIHSKGSSFLFTREFRSLFAV